MEYEDFTDQEQEHRDFEAGFEDMELRAMRLEAERANEIEAAMYEAEEEALLEAALDGVGATMAEYEAVLAFVKAFGGTALLPYVPTDDIPF